MKKQRKLFERRKSRVRAHLAKVTVGRPRLSVHRSHLHISAQIIDDVKGCTLAAASSLEKEIRGKLKSGGNIAAATVIGELLAKRAKEVGVIEVAFDRGGYLYHGRVKALAEAARAGGLSF